MSDRELDRSPCSADIARAVETILENEVYYNKISKEYDHGDAVELIMALMSTVAQSSRVRAETIEECAKIADNVWHGGTPQDAAEAIRALAQPSPAATVETKSAPELGPSQNNAERLPKVTRQGPGLVQCSAGNVSAELLAHAFLLGRGMINNSIADIKEYNGETWQAALDEIAPLIPAVTADEFLPRDAWNELVHKDDRTSPDDYPDMCLISFDELKDYMERNTAAEPQTASYPNVTASAAGGPGSVRTDQNADLNAPATHPDELRSWIAETHSLWLKGDLPPSHMQKALALSRPQSSGGGSR